MGHNNDPSILADDLTAEQKTDFLLREIATALQTTPSRNDEKEMFLKYRALEVSGLREHELNREKHELEVRKYQADLTMRRISLSACLMAILGIIGLIVYVALSSMTGIEKGAIIAPLSGLLGWVYNTLGKVSKSEEKFDRKPKV